jgi:HAD superfamily hydrolase (TIGR01509 family)
LLKALLFDLDGTLADTDPVHFGTWHDLLLQYGLEIDRPFYESHFSGRLNAAIVADLLPHLTVEQGAQLSWEKEAEFRCRAAQELKPLPGLLELLDWADAQGLKQAVVTNAPVENVEFMLQVLGLADRFPTVILAEHLERGKPDPLPYQVALQQLGVDATAAIAFEDSPAGVRPAVGAQILTIGITSTQSAQTLYKLGAALATPDFADERLQKLTRFAFQPNAWTEIRY